MSSLLYLAYGSNLHPRWLQSRVPSAEAIAKVALSGWQLQFNKQSRVDGSAKCNILLTSQDNDYVHGVIYRMNTMEKSRLDRAESGYDCIDLELNEFGRVMFYVANSRTINNQLQPYTWYRDIVIAGAMLHGLPQQYINRLEEITAIPDPDAARDNRHRSIVWSQMG